MSLKRFVNGFFLTGEREILLHGLMQFGESQFPSLLCMSESVFCDGWVRRLLPAHDPLGIKAVCFAEPKPGTLLFASETNALWGGNCGACAREHALTWSRSICLIGSSF